jgi:uncharacterized protein
MSLLDFSFMKKFSICFFILFTVCTFASDESHTSSVENFMSVMRLDKIFSTISENYRVVILNKYKNIINVDNEQELNLAIEYSEKNKNILESYYQSPKVKMTIMSMYNEAFTDEELNQIIAFYKKPVGQKVLNEMPLINEKAMRFYLSDASEIEAESFNVNSEFVERLKLLRKQQ